ncbi:hypothetical protein CSKR_109057 [Clonorchis sinensis]|uniref:Uncharacterized protein n=1 Tax=Clonorchis sinensis TaxID=79923 RepID=A0A3R7JJ99_CLOSI|nr:hypothetical protein CSKR_109057 [Clonorchis sinensis]
MSSILRCLHLQVLNQTIWKETDSTNATDIDQPPFLAMPSAGGVTGTSFWKADRTKITPFCQFMGRPPRSLRHFEGATEDNIRLGRWCFRIAKLPQLMVLYVFRE